MVRNVQTFYCTSSSLNYPFLSLDVVISCKRHYKIDYISYPFVCSKIKDCVFCLNCALCFTSKERESAGQLCKKGCSS